MFTVRPAVPADYPAMIDLLEAEEFHAHARECWLALDGGHSLHGCWLVAVTDARDGMALVGVAHADLTIDYGDLLLNRGVEPPHTYVSAIVIDRGRRGRGIGRQLLSGIAAAAVEARANFLVLVPQDGDGAPVAFFEACGLIALEAHTDGVPTRYGAPLDNTVLPTR
ncbi:GNAT family N-acetyltransferase [Micromonospora sp. DT227]|uniref:GNAT family N-acetyltransferase n=1 Tax=Micromonospora sp. DT227 TaxID=3393433 RepID=UPI003CEE9365